MKRSIVARVVFVVYVLTLFVHANPVVAQATTTSPVPQLVRDINVKTGPSDPSRPFVFNGSMYFFARTPAYGRELWRSDGTAAGTVMLKDLVSDDNEGTTSGTENYPFAPAAINDHFYFIAHAPNFQIGLWKSNGTADGTVLVKTFPNSMSLAFLTAFQDRLFFTLSGKLWRSDGTEAGTQPIDEIASVPTYGSLIVFKNAFYFAGISAVDKATYGAENNMELYRIMDAHTSPELMKDINPTQNGNNPGSNPENFLATGSTLFFTAYQSGSGSEIWATDGTSAGTHLVKDMVPVNDFSKEVVLGTTWNGKLYFFFDTYQDRELWSSDGTEAGTQLVSVIGTGLYYHSSEGNWISSALPLGSYLYFVMEDPVRGIELWRTNGTGTGTQFFMDINTQPVDSTHHAGSSEVTFLVAANGLLYMSARDRNYDPNDTSYSSGNRELWVTDVTLGNTRMVKDILPGKGSSNPTGAVAFQNKVFLSADDGLHGVELWETDGSAAGTNLLKDINAPTLDSNIQIIGEGIYNGEPTLFFGADDSIHGMELWHTTHQGQSASLFIDLNGTEKSSLYLFPPLSPVILKDRVIFVGCDSAAQRLPGNSTNCKIYSSAGTQESTFALTGSGAENYLFLSKVEPGTVYFALQNSSNVELWKTDGTVVGTQLVRGFDPGLDLNSPPVLLNNSVYFLTVDPGKVQLWRTNGTLSGTVPIHTITNVSQYQFFNLVVVNGLLFFRLQTNSSASLYQTDGTAEGTVEVRPGFSDPMAECGGRLYFASISTQDYQRYLYATNGKAGGVEQLLNIYENGMDPNEFVITPLGDSCYFLAHSIANGRSIWQTNGTASGTHKIASLAYGLVYSLVSSGRRLFFPGIDINTNQVELWASDGTAMGTQQFADIYPGVNSSTPQQLTVADHKLFFVAQDGTHGRELWVYTPDGSAYSIFLPAVRK